MLKLCYIINEYQWWATLIAGVLGGTITGIPFLVLGYQHESNERGKKL